MSDGRLRDAERRWREGGRLEDRVRWWSERARAGELPPGAPALVDAVAAGRVPMARVELAAYLGDARAQALALEEVVARVAHAGDERVLQVVLGEAGARLEDVLAWLVALRRWEPDTALLHALVAGTRHLADALAALDLSPAEGELYWLYPQREHDRQEALQVVAAVLPAVEALLAGDERQAARVASFAARSTGERHVEDAALLTARAVLGTRDLDETLHGWGGCVYGARPDPAALRAAVRDGVGAWALAEDPS